MKIICAPDLPFFETVLWHLKQIGAVGLIVVCVFATTFGIYCIYWLIAKYG